MASALAVGSVLLLLSTCSAPSRHGADELDEPPIVDMSVPRTDAGGCVGLGCFVANCPVGQDTTVIGRVTAPNGTDPVREALVYVPSGGSPEEFPPKVACEICNNPIGGKPVTAVTTDVDGTFQLKRVPVTRSTPLVIQKGRWRKVINLNVGRCETQGITAEEGRLPKSRLEGRLHARRIRAHRADAADGRRHRPVGRHRVRSAPRRHRRERVRIAQQQWQRPHL
jgi:hypothetical protein